MRLRYIQHVADLRLGPKCTYSWRTDDEDRSETGLGLGRLLRCLESMESMESMESSAKLLAEERAVVVKTDKKRKCVDDHDDDDDDVSLEGGVEMTLSTLATDDPTLALYHRLTLDLSHVLRWRAMDAERSHRMTIDVATKSVMSVDGGRMSILDALRDHELTAARCVLMEAVGEWTAAVQRLRRVYRSLVEQIERIECITHVHVDDPMWAQMMLAYRSCSRPVLSEMLDRLTSSFVRTWAFARRACDITYRQAVAPKSFAWMRLDHLMMLRIVRSYGIQSVGCLGYVCVNM